MRLYVGIGLVFLLLIGKTAVGWTLAVFFIAFGFGVGLGGD